MESGRGTGHGVICKGCTPLSPAGPQLGEVPGVRTESCLHTRDPPLILPHLGVPLDGHGCDHMVAIHHAHKRTDIRRNDKNQRGYARVALQDNVVSVSFASQESF